MYTYARDNPVTFMDPDGAEVAPRLTEEQITRLKAEPPPARIPRGARVGYLNQGRSAGTYVKGGGRRAGDSVPPGKGGERVQAIVPGPSVGNGNQGNSSGSPGDARKPAEKRTLSQELARLDDELSLGGSESREGGSKLGVHGGANPNASSSEGKQALFALLSLGAAVLDLGGLASAAKALLKKGIEKIGAKLGLDSIGDAVAEGIEQGAKDAVDEAAKSVAKNGVDDVAANAAKGVGSILADASDAAFRAADDVASWVPKNKHLRGGGSQSKAQFDTSDLDEVRGIVQEALRSSSAQFLPNPNLPGTFRVVTSLGRPVGVQGQEAVRVIVGLDGNVINAFPAHVR